MDGGNSFIINLFPPDVIVYRQWLDKRTVINFKFSVSPIRAGPPHFSSSSFILFSIILKETTGQGFIYSLLGLNIEDWGRAYNQQDRYDRVKIGMTEERSFISKLEAILVDPSIMVKDLALRRKAKLLSTFILFMVLFFTVVNVSYYFMIPGYGFPVSDIVGFLFLICAYFFSRTRFYKITAFLIMIMFPIVIFMSAVTGPVTEFTVSLTFLVLSYILCSIFLSIRTTIFVIGVNIAGIILLPIVSPSVIGDYSEIIAPLMVNLIAAGLIIISMHHRDGVEADRRSILKANEKKYRSLVNNVPVAVYNCIWDGEEWKINFISRKFTDITGYPVSDLIGKPADSILSMSHKQDKKICIRKVARAIQEKVPYDLEYRMFHKNGKELWIQDKGQASYDQEGTPISLDGVFFDATITKESQRKLDKAMKRSEFYLDLLGHDIGNLHQGIKTSITLAKIKKDDPLTVKKVLDSADQLASRSIKFVHNVLLLSRLNSMELHLEPTNIIPLLNEAKNYTKDLFPGKSIQMKINTNDEKCSVMAEPILEELFFNLIHNGVKFQDGDIARVEIDIVTSIDLGLVRIDFSDHGPGVPDELKETMFERFVKAGRSSQSGIGLSLVKALTERYKGKVKVQDRVKGKQEKGTTVRIYLPLAS